MAYSSRSFQSKTVTRLVGAYRRVSQVTERAVRQVRSTVTWAAQVVLYPIYVLFQAGRMAYRQAVAADPGRRWQQLLGRSPDQWVEQEFQQCSDGPVALLLKWLQEPDALQGSLQKNLQGRRVAARSPLRHLLALVPVVGEGLARYALAPGPADHQADSLEAGSLGTALSLMGAMNGLVASGEVPPLVPQAGEMTGQSPLALQGIASLLDSRHLVLVASGNQILDIFSPEQQKLLQRVMIWLMAEWAYYWRRREQRLQAGKLPLPQANRRAWWPIQIFYLVMRWMSLGRVAVVTNLFQEAELVRQFADRKQARLAARSSLHPEDTVASNPGQPGYFRLLPPSFVKALWPFLPAMLAPAMIAGQLPKYPVEPVPESPTEMSIGQAGWDVEGANAEGVWVGALPGGTLVVPLPTSLVARPALASSGLALPTSSSLELLSLGRLVGSQSVGSGGQAAIAATPSMWLGPIGESGATPWIEAKVTAVTYIDHPLVTVLRWIDKALLWLETVVMAAWQWLRSHITF